MGKRLFLLFWICSNFLFSFAQNNDTVTCAQIEENFLYFQKSLNKINTTDPAYIPLHYFKVQDIEQELKVFFQTVTAKFPNCTQYSYYDFISQFDDLSFRTRNLKDTLYLQKRKVDTLYYEKALKAIEEEHKKDAFFFVNRALQYNKLNPDALILKMQLEFENRQFDDCISLLSTLQHDAVLLRKHEMAISDFTLQFYDTLFQIGDNLLQEHREAEALDVFKTLEHFCKNMPTYFCNDDYYKGIIRSKMGVYHSYLKISKIAAERDYNDIAFNFLQYARDYAKDNSNEVNDTTDLMIWAKELAKHFSPHETIKEKEKIIEIATNKQESELLSPIEEDFTEEISLPLQETPDVEEQASCEDLFRKGFQMSIEQRTQEALEIFIRIKKEKCPCHYLDTILDILKKTNNSIQE